MQPGPIGDSADQTRYPEGERRLLTQSPRGDEAADESVPFLGAREALRVGSGDRPIDSILGQVQLQVAIDLESILEISCVLKR